MSLQYTMQMCVEEAHDTIAWANVACYARPNSSLDSKTCVGRDCGSHGGCGWEVRDCIIEVVSKGLGLIYVNIGLHTCMTLWPVILARARERASSAGMSSKIDFAAAANQGITPESTSWGGITEISLLLWNDRVK